MTMMATSSSIAQRDFETVWIPMRDGSRQIRLEATVYKPAGNGPFPVVIFNHGSTGKGALPADQTENPRGFGAYLVKKGIALVIPMRRGRGKSEGSYQELYECSLSQSQQGIRYAIESLDAVYEYLRNQEWANTHRIVLSGTSRGGLLSVVYAAERPGSAIGVLNFVGGWVSDLCNAHAGLDINEAIFREAGTRSKVPNLFLYAANDGYYTLTSTEKYAKAFADGGGIVQYKFYIPADGSNGHSLFMAHWKHWAPDVDAFLQAVGVWTP